MKPTKEQLAKRPKTEAKRNKYWLVKGVEVITPKGKAEVYSITEDNGVNTSLGNFCRSELSEIELPEKWVPQVGEWCECRPHNDTWGFIGISVSFGSVRNFDGNYFWWRDYEGKYVTSRLDKVDFRPIKTDREVLIDILLSTGSLSEGAQADAILTSFSLTKKDDE